MLFSWPIFDFLLGVLLIAFLDSTGAILSRKLDVKYVSLIPISLSVYIFIGFLLGKTSDYPTASLYNALLGLFDSTIGLKLSIHFNANFGVSKERAKQLRSLKTSLFMIGLALGFGSLFYHGYLFSINEIVPLKLNFSNDS